jgi:hypothetical protein
MSIPSVAMALVRVMSVAVDAAVGLVVVSRLDAAAATAKASRPAKSMGMSPNLVSAVAALQASVPQMLIPWLLSTISIARYAVAAAAVNENILVDFGVRSCSCICVLVPPPILLLRCRVTVVSVI